MLLSSTNRIQAIKGVKSWFRRQLWYDYIWTKAFNIYFLFVVSFVKLARY